jgi:SAM-dependent methyltransferase
VRHVGRAWRHAADRTYDGAVRREEETIVPACCYRDDYASVFRPEEAEAQARRFRRRGITGTGATVVSLLEAEGVEGAHVLEVGAGVGEVLVTLLQRGARQATDIDLVPGWVDAARAFLAEHAFSHRFEAHVGDVVDAAAGLPEADIVVLNRVACCYPDWRALLDAASGRSRRLLALVYPSERPWTRAGIGLMNLYLRLRGLRFRVFVHPEAAMIGRLSAAGFDVSGERTGLIWRTVVLRRRPH